jgi:multidrug efflux pump subunit AcrA (membrane-fusion protein)
MHVNPSLPLKVLVAVLGLFCFEGCNSTKKTGDVSALRSERDYAAGTEAAAQELYKTGQASSLTDARSQAAAAANQEWARAAKTAERKQTQDNFESELAKMDRKGK